VKKVMLVVAAVLLFACYLAAQDKPQEDPSAEAKKKLLLQVEPIKKIVSEIRGKQFLEDFKVGIKTKEQLREFILEEVEKEEARKEFEKTRKILLKLGLIPPKLDLKKTFVDVLTEQVAGFYDPDAKELYLMEGSMTGGPSQEMTVAHEILHALQDQYFYINAMVLAIRHNDDRQLATFSIIEGEATLLGFEYLLKKQGMSVLTVPMDIGKMMQQMMEGQLTMTPALANAPRFLRDTLLFRYIEGSSLVQKVLKKYNSWKELDRLFDNPPISTEQVMHPEKFLGEMDYPVRILLPQLHRRIEGKWKEIETNTMGEFAVKTLLREFLDEATATTAAAGWDGDSFTMVEAKEKPDIQIFAWLSVWDSPKDAKEFAEAYALALNNRFKTKARKTRTGYFLEVPGKEEMTLVELAGTQVLVIQDAPASLLPGIRSAMLTSRKIEMQESDFRDLSKQKLDLTPEPAEPPKPAEPEKNDK